jgi:hypothetical protein
MGDTRSANVAQYVSTTSTQNIGGVAFVIRELGRGIIDERSWYKRWYWGLCRDGGVLLFGLGPIEVSIGRSWS